MDPMTVIPLLMLVVSAEGARILGMFPNSAKSHHPMIQSVMKTLATVGHQVVVYIPYHLDHPHPNYTEVHLDKMFPISGDTKFIQDIIEMPYWKCIDHRYPLVEKLIHPTFKNNKIKKLLNSNESFDLVIGEPFFAQEFVYIFGHTFNVPTIGLHMMSMNTNVNLNMGNTHSITSIPDNCCPHSNEMTFMERLLNVFAVLRTIYTYYNVYLPMVEKKLRIYIPDSPPLLELTKNLSLVFTNDHMLVDYARPRLANMVPLGGIHFKPLQPLPQDIKQFMDEAQEGVILLSLGTYVPDELQPKEYFNMYINVFKQLQQRVIWKTRKDTIEGLPENVMIAKWLPQFDILAHPKCVLFITHGGLASQHETIYHGVPVVGIPHFGDQHRNVGFYHAKEIGVRVFLKDVSEKTIFAAIREVLVNPKYKVNMQRLSSVFRDQPLTPEESVVFWTEYVLRHNGTGHLRPASTMLSWYQLTLLDVLAAVLAVLFILAVPIYLLVRKMFCILVIRNTRINKHAKKTN